MEKVVAEELFAGGGEMGALMRSLDWSQTLLGCVSQWAQSLKTALSIILTSRYPMFIWWGAEYANLYNDAYRPILGASKHPQFLGQSAKDCWADVWDVVGPLADSVLTTGQPTWSEDLLLLMDRNGYREETYFTFSYSPVRDESGGVGGVFCAVTETTGQMIGERRLRTLRELAAKTAEAKTVEEACHIATKTLLINPHDIPFALLYRVEPDGKQARLAGTTAIEAGTVASPQQVDLSQESETAPWNLARVNRTGKAELVRDLAMRFGGLPKGVWSEEPTEALVIPIAQSGHRCGLLVVGISPRREFDDDYQGFFDLIASNVATAIANANAYEAERKRAAVLAELDRAKTTFFSNISHEFRTPLTLMLGSVEETLAGNEPLSTHQREQLEVAQRNSLRLLKLVNSLLDFSRFEAGRIQAVYEPTDLATFTRELASVFRSAIERAGMQLVVDCPPLPKAIYIDREMWEKIILNLLSNAFKFTFEGKITVALRWCTDHVEVDVSDTGIGIPENELPRLFERFHRLPGARGRTYEGSGIGLSLVQELVRLHGGTLGVASVEGQGSCFTVSIPAGFAHLPENQIGVTRTLTSTATQAAAYVEEALRWLPEEGSGEGGIGNREVEALLTASNQSLTTDNPTPDSRLPISSPARILLVDDNADMRDYVRRLLSQDYEVEAVSNGLAALDAVQRHLPDLVLTDVMMPGFDGLGLLRSLRNNPATQSIPIILLSARAGEESRVEGLEAGADDYLIKPFSARELLARVRTNLELARLRRESVRSEIALRRSEEQLRVAQQAAGAGLWDWDIVANRVTWSEDYYQLYGLDPATTSSYENWIASILETDRERAEQAAREALEHRTNLNVEFRVFHPIKGLRWLVALGQTFYDANAKPLRMTGIALDITARKQAEEALRQSEERLRLAMEGAQMATWDVDLITGKAIWSDQHFIMLGYEPTPTGEASEAMWYSRIHPEDRERVAQEWYQSRQEHRFYRAEYQVVRTDTQQLAWLAALGSFVYDQDGEAVRSIGVLFDITDRKQVEVALRESESRFRNIANYSPIMIWMSAPDGAGVWFNQQWCDFTGQTLLEALGSGWVAAVHPEDALAIETTCLQAHQRHEPVRLEYRLRRQDGEYRWVFDSAVPRFDDTGVYLGYIGSIIDITERKQAEAELQQTLQTLRTLIKASPLPIIVIQPNMTVQLWNPAAEQLFGWSEAEVFGQPIPIVPEEKREECRQVREAVAKGEVFAGVETYRCKQDGATVIVSISAAPLYNEQGSLNGILLIFRDITQRQRAEEALRQSEERLRLALLVSKAGIWDWDILQNRVTWSEHIYEFHGLAPGTFGGGVEDFAQLIHPDDRSRVSDAIRQALEEKASYELEFRAVQPSGTVRWLSTTGGVIFDAQGHPIRMLGATRDITERKAVDKEREQLLLSEQRAREEAERANRIKDEFLAVLSHELRSPLNPILGWAKLLQSRTLDEQKTKHALATIERNALLQTQLIEDLLDVSRILRGKLVLNAVPVNLASTIEAALETVRLAAEAKGIQIQRVLDPNVGQVMGESARLQQVIWNLLSNAVKFTPPGGTIEIRLEEVGNREDAHGLATATLTGIGNGEITTYSLLPTPYSPTHAQLQVKDTGKGINPEFLPHVFEYFRQEDGTTTRKFGGLGLGLAIVRHLVELHGGTVWADSPGEGQGATFTVSLPLMPLLIPILQDNPQTTPVAHLTGLRVLVVDDEPDIRDIVAFILEQAGAAVNMATCAAEALNFIKQSLPDVLICDIGMPDMDGYMLMRFLRTLLPEQGGKIPAIALTAYAGEVDQKQALAAGFEQHIAKPVEPDELVTAIARLVQYPRSI